MTDSPRVAVVGAGVSGLTAALALRDALGPTARIDVLEESSRPGGLLTSRTVAGVSVDAAPSRSSCGGPRRSPSSTDSGCRRTSSPPRDGARRYSPEARCTRSHGRR